MISLYSFAQQLRYFSHPAVTTVKTIPIPNFRGEGPIETQLFDAEGSTINAEIPITKGYSLPGMLYSLEGTRSRRTESTLLIQNHYIKPEFHGRDIGTSFYRHLERIALDNGIKKVMLVADPHTNALDYWTQKHGFYAPDRTRPLALEKTLE